MKLALEKCPVGAGGFCINCDKHTPMQIDRGTGKCSYLHVCSMECVEGVRDLLELALADETSDPSAASR